MNRFPPSPTHPASRQKHTTAAGRPASQTERITQLTAARRRFMTAVVHVSCVKAVAIILSLRVVSSESVVGPVTPLLHSSIHFLGVVASQFPSSVSVLFYRLRGLHVCGGATGPLIFFLIFSGSGFRSVISYYI
jgi:hypothetical protein